MTDVRQSPSGPLIAGAGCSNQFGSASNTDAYELEDSGGQVFLFPTLNDAASAPITLGPVSASVDDVVRLTMTFPITFDRDGVVPFSGKLATTIMVRNSSTPAGQWLPIGVTSTPQFFLATTEDPVVSARMECTVMLPITETDDEYSFAIGAISICSAGDVFQFLQNTVNLECEVISKECVLSTSDPQLQAAFTPVAPPVVGGA